MSLRTKHMVMAGTGHKLSTLNRSVVGSGYGAVLLDGGLGGQSSYWGLDNYIETTGRDPRIKSTTRGEGLADKISSKLSKLNIAAPTGKPKMKNIVLSI